MSALRRARAMVWEALLLELALYRSLARWVARSPDAAKGATAIGYARLVGPMLWLWIFGSATEVAVVDVVLRSWDSPVSEALRIPLLVLGVWGVLWMLGMLASYRVRPHVLSDQALVIRSGARTRVVVPLDAIDAIRPTEHDLPGVVRSLHVEDDLVLVGVSSRTNLELVLTVPTTLDTSRGPVTAGRVGLWVDDPRDVAVALRPQQSGRPRRRPRP